jgi:hypothetical protein
MAWDIVDHEASEPTLVAPLTRSERAQAAYLGDTLDVFLTLDLYAAMIWCFHSPDAPHRPEPQLDLDMATYSIVKAIHDDPTDPKSDWHWERKEAFHAVAERFGRAHELMSRQSRP